MQTTYRKAKIERPFISTVLLTNSTRTKIERPFTSHPLDANLKMICECCDLKCEELFQNNGEYLCKDCKPVCECCDESYGTVLCIRGFSVCEKCNNFECGVCWKVAEYCDEMVWCPKLGKCVCDQCWVSDYKTKCKKCDYEFEDKYESLLGDGYCVECLKVHFEQVRELKNKH